MNASPATTSVLPSLWRTVPFPEITKYNSHWAECAWYGKLHFPVGTRLHSKSNGRRLERSSEAGSRPSASEIPLKATAYFPPGDCHGSSLISFRLTFFMAVVKDSFFPIEVIGLISLHDQFFGSVAGHGPLAAVGVVT